MKLLKNHSWWLGWISGIITVLLLIRLFRLSVNSASDFEVYWYAIHAWVQGHSPYAQYSPVYNGLVFKYPPWILPLFLPFAALSLEASKWVWTIAQVAAIFYTMVWLCLKGVSVRVVGFVSLCFWWMWLAHTYFGQIMVFLLAFALWTHELRGMSFRSPAKRAFLAFLFTAKVFSLVSLLGIWRKLLQKRVIFAGFVMLGLSHLLLLISYPSISWSKACQLIPGLYHQWIHAASSGGSELGATIVRGQQNHGLVAAILRILHVEATRVKWDILVALVLAAILSALWHVFSKELKSEERWSGWLAIGVIAHPLAWHHSFIMTYPLCVFALQKALNSRNKVLLALAVLGICGIGIFIPQVIGVDAVVPLEYVGSKSWGVILCAVALILA